jgi:hypothetical protein
MPVANRCARAFAHKLRVPQELAGRPQVRPRYSTADRAIVPRFSTGGCGKESRCVGVRRPPSVARVASDLAALCFDAHDPTALARFWSELLGWEMVTDAGDRVALVPRDDTGYRLRFLPATAGKAGPNRVHLDLTSSTWDEQRATVELVLARGGRHLDFVLGPDEHHVPLADPEGNELCVIEPGNRFLDGCGRIGAINCEGTRAVGHFWSEALGWPLVWDQDEETAIQSPRGGSKITWSGPPVAPKTGTGRQHLDLVPSAGTDRAAEVARLVALGATRLDQAQLADPDGNEFCLAHG